MIRAPSHQGPAMMLASAPTITCPLGPPMAWLSCGPASRCLGRGISATLVPPWKYMATSGRAPRAGNVYFRTKPRGYDSFTGHSVCSTTSIVLGAPRSKAHQAAEMWCVPQLPIRPLQMSLKGCHPQRIVPVVNGRGGTGPSHRSQSTPGGTAAGCRGSAGRHGIVVPMMDLADLAQHARLDPLADQAGAVAGVALVAHLRGQLLFPGHLGQQPGLLDGVASAASRSRRACRVGHHRGGIMVVVGRGDHHGVDLPVHLVVHLAIVGVRGTLGNAW